MGEGTMPTVPSRLRAVRGGPELGSFSVSLKVVTPILGGSSQLRQIDEVEVIRPASVRGHLRFWWRALQGHRFATASELCQEEAALWGRAADEGGRSQVELRVDLVDRAGPDNAPVGPSTPGAYALFPARGEGKGSSVPRRKPGTRFRLTLTAPVEREAELQHAVRAWILFGGYGSRTRRGLGSLTVDEQAEHWLPAEATRQAFVDLFRTDPFAPPGQPAQDTPWLAGAALCVGPAERDAVTAWTKALDWLQEFRQGHRGPEGDRAREPDPNPRPGGYRPSISNWPEADKIRHLTGKTKGHRPRHNSSRAWPRAGFGLPIVVQFLKEDRSGRRLDEPGGVTLGWRSPDGKDHDRLASPLILKALPLAGGRYAPMALWLCRAYPKGEVVVKGLSGSGAAFDLLVAPGDSPRFRALEAKQDLRSAFFAWLKAHYVPSVVAP
jgi:CRISPR-associated protein Cmr1